MMEGILGDLDFCACYIDDSLMFSRNLQEHQCHLITMLDWLWDNGPVIKYNKCVFRASAISSVITSLRQECALSPWNCGDSRLLSSSYSLPHPKNGSFVFCPSDQTKVSPVGGTAGGSRYRIQEIYCSSYNSEFSSPWYTPLILHRCYQYHCGCRPQPDPCSLSLSLSLSPFFFLAGNSMPLKKIAARLTVSSSPFICRTTLLPYFKRRSFYHQNWPPAPCTLLFIDLGWLVCQATMSSLGNIWIQLYHLPHPWNKGSSYWRPFPVWDRCSVLADSQWIDPETPAYKASINNCSGVMSLTTRQERWSYVISSLATHTLSFQRVFADVFLTSSMVSPTLLDIPWPNSWSRSSSGTASTVMRNDGQGRAPLAKWPGTWNWTSLISIHHLINLDISLWILTAPFLPQQVPNTFSLLSTGQLSGSKWSWCQKYFVIYVHRLSCQDELVNLVCQNTLPLTGPHLSHHSSGPHSCNVLVPPLITPPPTTQGQMEWLNMPTVPSTILMSS